MINSIERADGIRVASLHSDWTDEDASLVAAGEFDILSIRAGGWTDFGFLAPYVNQIRRLVVAGGMNSHSGLERLVNLVEIDLEDCPTPSLYLMAFTKLERCYLSWHKRYPLAFFTLPRLSEVTLAGFTSTDCKDISQLTNLARLDLRKGSVASLDGLGELDRLKDVQLGYMRNLVDLSAIEQARQLEVLHIGKCPRVMDVDFIRNLPQLRELFVDCGSAGFDDLQWMEKLHALVDVLIAVPVRSIDWRILFALPKLRRVVVNTHPGYVVDQAAILAEAAAYGRTIDNFMHAGTKKHPAVKFWMD